MNNRLLLILALALIGAPPVYAASSQVVFAPSMYISSEGSELAIEAPGQPTKILADTNYKSMSPTLAISKGRLFARISTQFTIEPAQFENFIATTTDYGDNRGSYRRGESSINIGYRFYEGKLGSANVFGGFLSGNSSLVTTTSVYYSSTSQFVYNTETTKFYESGLFIGTNFTHPFGSQSLTVSLALAGLKGNLDDTYSAADSTQPTSSTNPPGHDYYDAKSSGLSFSIVWSGPMASNMDYKIGYKLVDYAFNITTLHDLVTGANIPMPPGSAIKEKINSFFIGSTIYF
jgi:hypothetical protein